MNPTLALMNGRIYTMDGRITEAAAVSGNLILKVGANDEIKSFCDNKTTVIDLNGRAVLPGFNDSHLHFLGFGLKMDMVDLRGARSIDEIIQITKKYIDDNNIKPGDWIVGQGWDQNKLKEKRMPIAADLDKITNLHPVILSRICTHTASVNHLALKVCSIDNKTEIKGGKFETDKNGNLTGYIMESAVNYMYNRMPLPDAEKVAKIIEKAQSEALKVGLTSLQTSDIEYSKCFNELYKGYKHLEDENKLDIRINEQLCFDSIDDVDSFINSSYFNNKGSDLFKIGPVKFIADGSLGAGSAALCESYSDDPGNCGILKYDKKSFYDIVSKVHDNGMQVHLHAIGDAALKLCIDAIENAQNGITSRRHRVNHVQIGNIKLYKRMASLGICADIQPSFVSSDWNMVEDRVGLDRAKTSYAWKTMKSLGIHLAGGSDCPIESFNPMLGIYAAVTRKGLDGKPDNGWMTDELLTVKEAIELYTTGSAYASFDENKKGTLTEGKLADMVVLSEDPFKIEKDSIKDIKVDLSIVDGKIKYCSI